MQRVLSFPPQSNRGFGDPSEFVTKRTCCSFMFSIAFLALLAGFLLGRFVFDRELELSRSKLRKAHQHHQQVMDMYRSASDVNASSIMSQVSAAGIQRHLESLVEASADGEVSVARLLRSVLRESAFDVISPLLRSQTKLSYPDSERENRVLIVSGEDVILRCADPRPSRSPRTADRSSARITGNVVYVNFGRDEDYDHLDSLGLELKDSIALARVGQIPHADVVTNALEHEASGVVLYRDPQQRDLLEPYLSPSDLARLSHLHHDAVVPVLFVSSDDAERILNRMSTSAPSSDSWRGNLNSTYPIGPGFSGRDAHLVMDVNTVTVAFEYHDVVGGLRGTREPDDFVVIAHERTGEESDTTTTTTAVFMEVVRTLGFLRKTKNWRPVRSVVVASWGSESRSRWAELRRDAVAYLKIDADIGNGSTTARGTPLLEDIFREAVGRLSLGSPHFEAIVPPGTSPELVQSGVPFLQMDRSGARSPEEAASLWSYLAWKLSQGEALPFALDGYRRFLNRSAEVVRGFAVVAHARNLFLDSFFDATQRLLSAISSFQSQRPATPRVVNERYLKFARGLACRRRSQLPTSSSSSSSFRHEVFSSARRGPRDSGFGVLLDLLRETTSANAPRDLHHRIIAHVAGLVECLDAARYALADELESLVAGRNDTAILLA